MTKVKGPVSRRAGSIAGSFADTAPLSHVIQAGTAPRARQRTILSLLSCSSREEVPVSSLGAPFLVPTESAGFFPPHIQCRACY